ncbi:MAG: VOC family protein [Chloroflexota bacterium]
MTHEAPLGALAITQIAIVVKDLRATMELYHRTLGWGPWEVYESFGPPLLHDTAIRGVPVSFTVHLAGTLVGPLAVELVQPVGGPSIFQEWLDRRGEGIHHIGGVKVGSDTDALHNELAGLGVRDLLSGSAGRDSHFFFLDSEPLLKFIFESGSGDWSDVPLTYIYPVPE